MTARILAVFLTFSVTALAGDREFEHLVKGIESHYGTKRTHIPVNGVANSMVKVAHPSGTSGFKLAVFEDLDCGASDQDWSDLDRFLNDVGRGSLHPLLRVHSNRRNSATYIFAGEAGKSTKLLIATFEKQQATVVEVKVNVDILLKTLSSPGSATASLTMNTKRD